MKIPSPASKKVAIVWDRIYDYRLEFHAQLFTLGKDDNIEYTVYSSHKYRRVDNHNFSSAHLKNIRLKYPRNLYFHYRLDKVSNSDLIVMEQALHNPVLIARFWFDRKWRNKVYFWGHGGYWTKKNSGLQNKLLWYFVKRVNHFLVYTDGGAARLIKNNYPASQISVLKNSIDSRLIIEKIQSLSSIEHDAWMDSHGLDSSSLGCFIGEIKREKKLDFLIEALITIKSEVSSFQFIFFGYGSGLEEIVKKCKKYSWIKFGGVASELEKAHLSKAGAIILNPGRIGLIAVDSIAMATPLVTCRLQNEHAPEIEYLSHPKTIRITDLDSGKYALEVVSLLNAPRTIKLMTDCLKELQPEYSIEAMVNNFHVAVKRGL
jgi:glycosyltransferase involved in cell wall biosynthesis